MPNQIHVLALAIGLGGCSPKPTMAIGGVTAGFGLIVASTPDKCGGPQVCFGARDVGVVLAVVGLLTLGAGAVLYGMQETAPQPPQDQPIPSPSPAPVVSLHPLPAAELTYSDATQRQMAIQASAAARRHDCRAALASAKELTVETRRRLATVDEAFARCDR